MEFFPEILDFFLLNLHRESLLSLAFLCLGFNILRQPSKSSHEADSPTQYEIRSIGGVFVFVHFLILLQRYKLHILKRFPEGLAMHVPDDVGKDGDNLDELLSFIDLMSCVDLIFCKVCEY